jgi:hypothetical protein
MRNDNESSFWFWFPLVIAPVALFFGAPLWAVAIVLFPYALLVVLAPFALLGWVHDKYRELVQLGKDSN